MEGAIMAKNQARKRDSGTGCVTCKRGRKNPYMALVSENNVQDGKVSYKSIGSFKTRREAEYALEVYHENPIDYSQKIKTFEDLYNAWSYYYFEHVSVTATTMAR